MKPIWFFVGLMLVILGALVMIAGIVGLTNSGERSIVMAELHPNLWWGGLMLVVGLIYLVANWNKKV